MNNKMKKGQVWIETVLYTLIGLALMGLVLAFVVPKIGQEKDSLIVEQTINSLNVLDDKINVLLESGPDNKRIIEFGLSRGDLYFNSETDEIIINLAELKKPYTEPGIEVNFGRIKVLSVQGKKTSDVQLKLDYKAIANIEFAGKDEIKIINPASRPYKFSIENLGRKGGLFEVINFDFAS